jgi:hypothetical protein
MGLWEVVCVVITGDVRIRRAITVDSCDRVEGLKKK